MIYLTATTDKLQLVTSTAATVDVSASYIEAVTSGITTPVPGRQNTAISSATTTDVLAAPASSNTRTLKQLTARNKDASLSDDVTLLYNANGTTYELHKVTLQPGDAFIYIEGIGFFTNRAAALLDRVIVMSADYVNATTSFSDITGLTVGMLSGKKYIVKATLFHVNNASTTGSQFGYNIGAAPTVSIGGNVSAVTNSVTAGVVAIGTATARDTAFTAETTGQTATGMTQLELMLQPSADGTFALRGASEVAVAAGLTVKAGSFMEVRQER